MSAPDCQRWAVAGAKLNVHSTQINTLQQVLILMKKDLNATAVESVVMYTI